MMTGAWGMTLGGWVWMVIWVVALIVMVWLIVGGSRGQADPDDKRGISDIEDRPHLAMRVEHAQKVNHGPPQSAQHVVREYTVP